MNLDRRISGRHRIFPVLRSRQNVNSLPPLSITLSPRPASTRSPPSAPVRKIKSLVMTGDEWPKGSVVFQTTFLLGPNSVGTLVTSATPEPFTPRNIGQSLAVAETISKSTSVGNNWKRIRVSYLPHQRAETHLTMKQDP